MKKQILTLVGVLSLLFAAGSVQAQSIHVKANVPFEFKVLNKTVPAGEYSLVSNGSIDSHVLAMRSGRGTAVSFVSASIGDSRRASSRTVLIFHRYGDTYYLSGLALSGADYSWKFPRGKAETEQAQVSAANEVLVASTGR